MIRNLLRSPDPRGLLPQPTHPASRVDHWPAGRGATGGHWLFSDSYALSTTDPLSAAMRIALAAIAAGGALLLLAEHRRSTGGAVGTAPGPPAGRLR